MPPAAIFVTGAPPPWDSGDVHPGRLRHAFLDDRTREQARPLP